MVVAVAGLVPVPARWRPVPGALVRRPGPGGPPRPHDAYLSALLLGLGLAFWSLIPILSAGAAPLASSPDW